MSHKIEWTKIEPRYAKGGIDDMAIDLQSYLDDKKIWIVQATVAQDKFSSDMHLKNLVTKDYEYEINLQEILKTFPSYFDELIIQSCNSNKLTA